MMKRSSKQKVTLFSDTEALSDDVISILDDKAVLNKYATLLAYLTDTGHAVPDQDWQLLQQQLETSLESQVTELVLLQYLKMSNAYDWGDAGEFQIEQGMLQWLQRKMGEGRLEDHIETLKLKYNLQGLSVGDIQVRLNSFSFSIFQLQFPISKSRTFNQVCQFLGSTLYLHSYLYGDKVSYILAPVSEKRIDNHVVRLLDEEVVRSPGVVTSLAALSGDREVTVRKESLRMIFDQKWVSFLDQLDHFDQVVGLLEYDVSSGIKQHVLQLYEVSAVDQLQSIRTRFINNMSETVIYHELGHVVSQGDIMAPETGAITEATKIFGETILMQQLEVLADLSPRKGMLMGAFWNMVRVSETDEVRATRLFYTYFSDVWFYDTEDTYMYLYSDLICMVILRYIRDDLTVRFEKMAYDLTLETTRVSDKRLLMVCFEELKQGVSRLIQNVSKMPLSKDGHQGSFSSVMKVLLQQCHKENVSIKLDDYQFLNKLWVNALSLANKMAVNPNEMDQFFESESSRVLKRYFVLTAGEKVAKSYQFDHRQYIFDRCQQLGLTLENQSKG